DEALALHPDLVEMHFTEADLDYELAPPAKPYPQQLFVHAPEVFDRRLVDLCSLDEERREGSFDPLQRTTDKAASLQPHFTGPVGVVIHVGGMTMDEPVADTSPMVDRAAEMFRRFETRGVELLPENLPPRPWYL